MVDEQRDRAVDAVAAHGQAFGHGRGEAILLRRQHPLHALAFERDPVPDRRRHIPSPSVWSVLTMGGGGLQDETCRGRGARSAPSPSLRRDRKRVVSGKSVSVRVDLGGRGVSKKKKTSK